MKFAAKLSCAMILVLAVSLSAGGCMLLYGDFSDRLAETSTQNEVQHGLPALLYHGGCPADAVQPGRPHHR